MEQHHPGSMHGCSGGLWQCCCGLEMVDDFILGHVTAIQDFRAHMAESRLIEASLRPGETMRSIAMAEFDRIMAIFAKDAENANRLMADGPVQGGLAP
jgi:hypothetical protein